jgi:hypothetical protein
MKRVKYNGKLPSRKHPRFGKIGKNIKKVKMPPGGWKRKGK